MASGAQAVAVVGAGRLRGPCSNAPHARGVDSDGRGGGRDPPPLPFSCYRQLLPSPYAALFTPRSARPWQLIEAKEWEAVAVRDHGQATGVPATPRGFWHSFVTGKQQFFRPGRGGSEDDRAAAAHSIFLERLGMRKYATRFDDEGFDDPRLVRDMSEDERVATLVDDFGMDIDDARRFSAAVIELLTPDAEAFQEV